MSELIPKQLFEQYKNKKLKMYQLEDKLITFLKSGTTELLKSEAIEYLSKLKLKKLNLTGKLRGEIPNLNKLITLEELYLSYNSIAEIKGIENLVNLKKLYLTRNNITKIEGFENLIDLRHLDLSENYISNINGLDNLENLEYLNLSSNPIQKIKGLKNLINLQSLMLMGINLLEIEGLDTLINLKRLALANNNISEIKGLENLKSLKELIYLNNKIQEIKGLKNLTNLEILRLERNKIIEIKGLDTLVNLKILNLTRNKIKEIKGLNALTKLERLGLSGNSITEVKGLENLKNLKMLGLNISENITGLVGNSRNAQDFVNYCRYKKLAESDLSSPNILYDKYKNKLINKLNLTISLVSIIENYDYPELRLEALSILEKLNLKAEEILYFLENLAISDSHEVIKASTLRFIIKKYFFQSNTFLTEIIENELPNICITAILEELIKLDDEESDHLIHNIGIKYGYEIIEKDQLIAREVAALKYIEIKTKRKVCRAEDFPWRGDSFIAYKVRDGHINELMIYRIKCPNLIFLKLIPNLEKLEVFRGELEEINYLTNLVKLKKLDLAFNKISEIKGLENLTELVELNLSKNNHRFNNINNGITEIKGLETLKNLEYLSLNNNSISKIKGLDNLINLRWLILENNQINRIEGLERLKNLHILRIINNPINQNIIEELEDIYINFPKEKDELYTLYKYPFMGIVRNAIRFVNYCRDGKIEINHRIEDSLVIEFKKLESLLITSLNVNIRANSAQKIILNYLDQGKEILEWIIKKDKSKRCLKAILVNLTKVDNDTSKYLFKLLEDRFARKYEYKYGVNPIEAIALGILNLNHFYSISGPNESSDGESYTDYDIKDGHVTQFIIKNEFPDIQILELFPHLKKLKISDHESSHFDFTGLGRLKELEELILEFISINDLEELSGLSSLIKLRNLKLLNMSINEIKNIDNLVNLEELSICGDINDDFRGEISEIKGLNNLSKLKELELYSNNISEIQGLENLNNLEKLDLSCNKIKEIKGLESLVNLKSINLYDNPIVEEELKYIAETPQKIVEYCRQKKLKLNPFFSS